MCIRDRLIILESRIRNLSFTFFYKKHLYKELEAKIGSKTSETLKKHTRNLVCIHFLSTNEYLVKKTDKNKEKIKELWASDSLNK